MPAPASDAELARLNLRWTLWGGLVLLVLGALIAKGSAADEGNAHADQHLGSVVYGWMLVAGGGCALLVALIGDGVLLGTRAARD